MPVFNVPVLETNVYADGSPITAGESVVPVMLVVTDDGRVAYH